MSFKLATWNINSVRLREPIVLKLLREEGPDILCLQECKSLVELIPRQGFLDLGILTYRRAWTKGLQWCCDYIQNPVGRCGWVGSC